MKHCFIHVYRLRHNLPLDRILTHKGTDNPKWNGGVAYYPNHYELKLIRKEKMASVKDTCEDCGKPAKYIHHKDHSKTNHSIDNLLALCGKCHARYHSNRHRRTLYIGITLHQIAAKAGCSAGTVIRYLKYNKKTRFDDIINNIKESLTRRVK